MPAMNRPVRFAPVRLVLLALILTLAGMFVATIVHGTGANEGYDIARSELQTQHGAELAALKAGYDREMADAYMDNAILRDRLMDYQSAYAAERERAEQATAERDYARSRLGAYEPRFRDHPIDALAAPRPGTETRQLR